MQTSYSMIWYTPPNVCIPTNHQQTNGPVQCIPRMRSKTWAGSCLHQTTQSAQGPSPYLLTQLGNSWQTVAAICPASPNASQSAKHSVPMMGSLMLGSSCCPGSIHPKDPLNGLPTHRTRCPQSYQPSALPTYTLVHTVPM